jgi:glycosyltransferase involved in cell wall biosynthesis
MKKVLLTVHKFFPEHRAGTEVLTLNIAKELQARGYKVLVVTANPPDLDARRKEGVGKETSSFEYEGVPVHVVEEPLRLKDYRFSYEYDHPHIASHFRKLFADFQPDLVQIMHAQNHSAAPIDVARELNIPVVFYSTDFWFVCPIVQLKRPDGSICRGPGPGAIKCLDCYTPKLFPPLTEFKEALGVKYPLTAKNSSALHSAAIKGLYSAYIATKLPDATNATLRRPAKLRDTANKMQAILVPTRLMKDVFVENGIDAKLIHHVPFGINLEALAAHREKSESDVVRIGFVGTLFEHKGVDLLIKAFLALPPEAKCNLSIYGSTEQFPEYGKKLLDMACDGSENARKIAFRGTFPQARFGEILAGIDVLVIPSRWYENTPLVMQSALATRTPLVATDLGGMAEVIEHDKTGLLFKLNSAESLKEQLLRIVNEPSLLKRFREAIKPERSVEDMVDDIEKIYAPYLRIPTSVC